MAFFHGFPSSQNWDEPLETAKACLLGDFDVGSGRRNPTTACFKSHESQCPMWPVAQFLGRHSGTVALWVYLRVLDSLSRWVAEDVPFLVVSEAKPRIFRAGHSLHDLLHERQQHQWIRHSRLGTTSGSLQKAIWLNICCGTETCSCLEIWHTS